MDNFDTDEIVKIAQEVTGAPKRMLRKKDDVAAMREQKAQQRQLAEGIATAGAAGQAANEAIPAAQALGDMMGQAGLGG